MSGIRCAPLNDMHRWIGVLAIAALVGCGANDDDDRPNGTLAGTGTVDSLRLDTQSEFARENGIAWWEVELRLLDDDIDRTTGVISTTDSMRVAVDFWAHAGDGSVKADGRFAIDLTRWLSLSVERDPTDVAAIFEGSRVASKTVVLSADAQRAYFDELLAVLAENPAEVAAAASALSIDSASLGTCVGAAKSALKKALSSVSATFGKCSDCAARAIEDIDSDKTWAACGKCEDGIKDAKSALGLFDVLACKKALVLPGTGGGDADDAGGPLVKIPETVTTKTCYEQSADKVKGTMRVTDGKGAVACADCPSDMVPADNKLGCAPADPVSLADETKSIVFTPAGSGQAGTPRVVSADACVVVDVSANGTVNSIPVEKSRRIILKLGQRSWGALPKNVQSSKDQWDLTSNQHSSATKGRYAISGATAASKPTPKHTGTVEEAIARGGCASRPVYGLSQQILEELARCVKPGFLVKVQSGGQLNNNADHGYLEKPAADALAAALKTRPGKTMNISSMYRTIAQQYFLYRRAACFPAVAKPGRSNHESGIALDVSDPDNSTWRAALQSVGFNWLGSWDRFHFDYRGAGSVDLRGEDVRAFQRLWNRNHPEDKIAEDGAWGGDTESRLKQSPANGFAIGVPDSCAEAPKAEIASKGSREPYEYLTNVTAELLPGEGCETGSDASHTDVNACVTVKQVCDPFWCDLADQRTPECR